MSAENVEHGPNFEVPQTPDQQGGQELTPQTGIEQGGVKKESAPRSPAQTVPAIPAQAAPPPQQPPPEPQQQSPSTSAAPASSHLPADDVDLIERQWVDKAKQIVSETRDDPHKQKDQISRVKADYIQKRFNKSIKVDDAATP